MKDTTYATMQVREFRFTHRDPPCLTMELHLARGERVVSVAPFRVADRRVEPTAVEAIVTVVTQTTRASLLVDDLATRGLRALDTMDTAKEILDRVAVEAMGAVFSVAVETFVFVGRVLNPKRG